LGPNKILQLIHEAEAAGIFPPHVKSKLTDEFVYGGAPKPNWDAHIMEEKLKATTNDAVYEMLTMAILASIAMMVYRALTTKPEDDEGGGGGGHGH
jgi:hypothetical protein